MKVLLLLLLLVWRPLCSKGSRPVYTHVAFMYNIKRGELGNNFKRSYDYYLSYFDQLLASSSNLIVFGGKDLQDYVWKRRKQANTVFVQKQLGQFRKLWYENLVQKCREQRMNDPNFPYKGHPQFALPDYNPIIMSKLYVLTEALQHDKWNTDIIVWTDGGYMHQFPRNVFSPENVVQKFFTVLQPQWMFFTYNDGNMFLGYRQSESIYIGRRAESTEAVLASCMGGYIEILRDIKSAYQNLLRITLQNGDMNSDQSVITLMPIRFPFLIPSTTGIYLNDVVSKLRVYQQVDRTPHHPHTFNIQIKGNQLLIPVDSQVSALIDDKKHVEKEKYLMNPVNREELKKQQKRKDTNKDDSILEQYDDLVGIIKRQGQYLKENFYKGFCYLGMMILSYLAIVKKNYNLKVRITYRRKQIGKQYSKGQIIISSSL